MSTRAHALAIGTALALCALGAGAADRAPLRVPDTLAERVRACTACHGPEGRATPYGYFPRIAGKPAGYLFAQLRHFRDGQRENALMSDLVSHLSDDYLREIAAYFSGQDLPYPAPRPSTLESAERERAAALVTHGDAARGVPACTRCHGDAMTGVQPAVPGLLGLPRDYLVAQFGAWRNGTRHAATPDCMHRVAQALSADEVSLVANWLAAQPVPADAHPAAALAQALPLECGSVASPAGTASGAAR